AQTFPRGGATDMAADRVGVHVRRQWSPHLTARLGYGLLLARYSGSDAASIAPAQMHDIDAGVDYHRDVTIRRRTTLTFSTGTSVVSTPLDGAHPVATGSATLSRDIGRSWR